MTTAPLWRNSGRHARVWAALVATVALIASPLLALGPVHAAPGEGYVGTVEGDGPSWPDSHLATMTTDESYDDSLTAPFPYDERNEIWYGITGSLPDGISAELTGTTTLRLFGTPTNLDTFEFTITWFGTENSNAVLSFEVTAVSGKISTTTNLEVPEVLPYDAIAVKATVGWDGEAVPTGQVAFAAGSVTFATDTIDANGVALDDKAIDISYAGTTQNITASYTGDANYASSTSAPASVLIYVPTARGEVRQNGLAVSGASVSLLNADDVAVDTATTIADGRFELSPGAIATVADAKKEYTVRVTMPDDAVLFYNGSGAATDSEDATAVGPLTWKSDLNVAYSVAPVWTDETLATPREYSEYSDAVAAASPNAVTYSVYSGALPVGLTLYHATGVIRGTPSCGVPCNYDFTIEADNGYGTVVKRFTGTTLRAGIAPTWEDKTLVDLQVGSAVTDGVLAAGDPTITYSVTAGHLPAGLSLVAETGAITGTPTAVGEFPFTVTAANAYGSITAGFEGVVSSAPEIDLVLDFRPGAELSDASSTISAGGLKVGSEYTLTMHSDPVVLYRAIVGPTGGFTWNVALPADTPVGAHRLVLSGIAPDGSTMTAEAWFTLLANGTIGAISYTGPLTLAYTGTDVTTPIAIGSGLLVMGALALAVSRRRRRA
jgi:hypothetical protein